MEPLINRRVLPQITVRAALTFPTTLYAEERAGSVEEVKGEAFAEAGTQRRALDRLSALLATT
jgi:hypothetical protein